MLRVKILAFRERFRRLDRKWQLLIGSQILFGLGILRTHRMKEYEELGNSK
jgi:hypothetical protein